MPLKQTQKNNKKTYKMLWSLADLLGHDSSEHSSDVNVDDKVFVAQILVLCISEYVVILKRIVSSLIIMT